MATIIDDIEQSISSISPLMKTSEVINIPADEDAFVAAYEVNNDDLVKLAEDLGVFRNQLNTSIGQINTANNETEINSNDAKTARDEAVTAVATLQGGVIDDITIALNKAYSNQKTNELLDGKADKDISGYTSKTTPIDTDLLPLSDSITSFGAKKLSWANIKATLKTYFDTLYNFYNPTPTIATGTATFTATTNNINLTGIGIGVEIGDVIQISGAEDAKNNSEFTVEVITDANNIIVNQAHANKGTSKNVAGRASDTGVTVKLLAKWYSTQIGLGQGLVSVTRSISTNYQNTTNRPIEAIVFTNGQVGVFTMDGSNVGTTSATVGQISSFIIPANSIISRSAAYATWYEIR